MDSSNELTHPRWKAIWDGGLQQGERFDAHFTSPALLKLLKDGEIKENISCLVPGCGRAYDVYSLWDFGKRRVLGVDIVDSAVDAANTWITEQISSSSKLSLLSTTSSSASACPASASVSLPYKIETKSFFDIEEQFDFVYDYTFFCALDPSIRKDWAKKMSEIVKPGGEIVALIFPICNIPSEVGKRTDGPPFEVSLNLVSSLLLEVGFECNQLELLPKELCHAGRDGDGEVGGRFYGLTSGLGRFTKK